MLDVGWRDVSGHDVGVGGGGRAASPVADLGRPVLRPSAGCAPLGVLMAPAAPGSAGAIKDESWLLAPQCGAVEICDGYAILGRSIGSHAVGHHPKDLGPGSLVAHLVENRPVM